MKYFILALLLASPVLAGMDKGPLFKYRQYRMELTEANEEHYNHHFWSRVWVRGGVRVYERKDGTVRMTPTGNKFDVKIEHNGMKITVHKGGALVWHPFNVEMEGRAHRESPKHWVVTEGLNDIRSTWPAFIVK